MLSHGLARPGSDQQQQQAGPSSKRKAGDPDLVKSDVDVSEGRRDKNGFLVFEARPAALGTRWGVQAGFRAFDVQRLPQEACEAHAGAA